MIGYYSVGNEIIYAARVERIINKHKYKCICYIILYIPQPTIAIMIIERFEIKNEHQNK